MCHNGLWVYSSDDTEFIRRYSWWVDYSRILAEATYSVGADTNWGWKKSHRFHRYTQIFLGTFFKVTQISQMTQIFFIHRMTRNLFGDFLRRQLLTDFHGGDLSGRCRYPLRLEKVPQRKICVYLWNLWDEIISTKKNLRHLRNLRDKKQQEHISGASHWPAAKVPRNSVSNPISKNASDSSVKSDEKNEETKKWRNEKMKKRKNEETKKWRNEKGVSWTPWHTLFRWWYFS